MSKRESLQDFVRRPLEDSSERLLDERNDFLAENLKVRVDGLIDDLAEGLVSAKQVLEIDFASLDVHFDVHLANDEMCLSVDLLVDSPDPHIASAAGEVALELAVALNGQEQDSAVDHIPTDDKQVRKLNLERVLGCIFNDPAKAHEIIIKNAKMASTVGSSYFKFFRT